MTTPPRRRFFQIHLSTAIVLMFVAGAMLWLNFRARIVYDGAAPIYFVELGWPATMVAYWTTNDLLSSQWNMKELFINSSILFLVLALVAFVSELYIRDHKVPK